MLTVLYVQYIGCSDKRCAAARHLRVLGWRRRQIVSRTQLHELDCTIGTTADSAVIVNNKRSLILSPARGSHQNHESTDFPAASSTSSAFLHHLLSSPHTEREKHPQPTALPASPLHHLTNQPQFRPQFSSLQRETHTSSVRLHLRRPPS